MDRRQFIAASAAGVAGAVLAPHSIVAALSAPRRAGYGPLGAADANGLRLPAGFTSRVVARSGLPVGLSPYVWHLSPDGGGVFSTPDGGWIYVSNSERYGFPEAEGPPGGAGAIRFAADGTITGAYSILTNTQVNCAGGTTPWGTWLSCEELDGGAVWECDPLGLRPAEQRPALGRFAHEAAVVDPASGDVYLTEDDGEAGFYRFRPTRPGDLSSGVLEIAVQGRGDRISWVVVDDPSAATVPTREQVPSALRFQRLEGATVLGSLVYFAETTPDRIWSYDVKTSRLAVVYDAALLPDSPLHAVDNLCITPRGDLLVAEDGDDMQIVLLRNGQPSPVIEVVGHPESEMTGIAFSPLGDRLYFSSQRGDAPGDLGLGITYEVRGPF